MLTCRPSAAFELKSPPVVQQWKHKKSIALVDVSMPRQYWCAHNPHSPHWIQSILDLSKSEGHEQLQLMQ